MAEIRNLPIEEAQRRLEEQLAPRSEAPSGTRFEDDYEQAVEEQATLESHYQSRHKSFGLETTVWPKVVSDVE